MLKVYDSPDEPVPPECRATVDALQRLLDGDVSADALGADPHANACAACRERVRAARVLLSVLAAPAEPVAVPEGFADRVVTAMWAERHTRTRRQTFAAAVAALAAAILVAVGLARYYSPPPQAPVFVPDVVERPAKPPEPAPAPREKPPGTPEIAPAPRPLRVGEALAQTGQAILDAPKPLAESVSVAPKLFDALSGPFKLPAAPVDPMAVALEPARKSIVDLPVVAQHGLEPVTGTAEKAFNRFLQDVGAVKPNS
jgi:hypothetical protein